VSDVVDYTRVVLTDGDPDTAGSDYINANHVKVISQSLQSLVLTQLLLTC